MKMPFKRDAASALVSARAKRVAIELKLTELAASRSAALMDSDDDGVVTQIDDQITAANRSKAILDDRTAALELIVRERRAEETERQRQAAIAVVEQRGAEEVELARQVERDMRAFAKSWNTLIGWRARMIYKWPPQLALPPVDAFVDLADLMREGGMMYFGLGNPTALRHSSLPKAVAPVAVAGLEPLGLGNYVAGAVSAFVARLKNTRIQTNNDQEAA